MPASTLLLVDFGWTDAREVPQFSTRKRRVAGRPWAGVRPARPKGSHKHYPFLSNSSSAYSSSPPAESSNERRRVAVRHLPGRRTARLCEPQKQNTHSLLQFCWVRACALPERPHAPLMRRCARGRRFPSESRYSLSTQSSPQFSAPCPPHCGSAFAPPRMPSPAGISARFCSSQNE